MKKYLIGGAIGAGAATIITGGIATLIYNRAFKKGQENKTEDKNDVEIEVEAKVEEEEVEKETEEKAS